MLKHVHQSPSRHFSGALQRSKVNPKIEDGGSLNSTRSSDSYFPESGLSSRSSSTSSLCGSLSFATLKLQCLVKIYAQCLRSDIEYKTLCVGPTTTSKEVITTLLNKYRMKHRDPNLFFLIMEVELHRKGSPLQTLIVLDDEEKLAELMSCYPRGSPKFTLQMRRGGLIKVYDSVLMACSKYKSLLVSEKTTVEETIKIILNCNNRSDQVDDFCLFEVSQPDRCERKLHFAEKPVKITRDWAHPYQHAFVLHHKEDPSGQCSLENCFDNKVPQLSKSKVSYNDYENYFYI